MPKHNAAPISKLKRFSGCQEGNIAIVAAVFMPVALALAAISVDVGSLYSERRRFQSLADLTAIAAAGRTADAEAIARAMLNANGKGDVVLTVGKRDTETLLQEGAPSAMNVEVGRYEADLTIAPEDRFVSGKTPANAVRVSLNETGKLYFGRSLLSEARIGVVGTAVAANFGVVSIGSRLASLNDGIVNAVLGGLIGANIGLNVMDYRALAKADVSLFGSLDQLATDLDLTAASYDELLATNISMAQWASALAAHTVSIRGQSALKKIATGNGATEQTFMLEDVIDIGRYGTFNIADGASALAAKASVADFLAASVRAATGSKQVEIDLGSNIAGIASAKLYLAIGEPAQFISSTGEGGSIRTAQTRFLLDLEIDGAGTLPQPFFRLPIYAELAFAEANLKRIYCTPGVPVGNGLEISVRPGIASLAIAEIDTDKLANFGSNLATKSVSLIKAPLIEVQGRADIEVGESRAEILRFNATDMRQGTIKKVSTQGAVQSLMKSLINDLQLEVDIAGLSLSSPDHIETSLRTALTGLAPALDEALEAILTIAGVGLGEADVRAHGVACQHAVLVQ
ncbi:pilus assembly protein TadG-related protein [Tepidamorphus sp. 3E244]|uniref:pilus assembly protein TadG-related protein n=1 Tax=Tepidamorphus sp. 3E244 TaxID=3385498 RepID=UPI0038FC9865